MNIQITDRDTIKYALAATFIESFPLSDDLNDPTTFTAHEFDDWALRRGHYGKHDTTNTDTLNMIRGVVRKQVNEAAVSDAYTMGADDAAFKIEVHKHSCLDPLTKDRLPTVYRVVPAARAFASGALDLTKKVNRVMVTRRQTLTNLLAHADWGTLSPELKAQAKQQLRSINNWGQRIALDTQIMESDFASFYRDMLEADASAANLMIPDQSDDDEPEDA